MINLNNIETVQILIIIKQGKKQYYAQRYSENLYNPKMFWNTTNEILFNKSSNKSNQDIQIKVNNNIISNHIEVANEFNKFLTNVGNYSNNLVINNVLTSYSKISNMYLVKTTANEISEIISSLIIKAASGKTLH